MLSNIFDFPLPFSPVMALKLQSNPETSVLCAYDLKPSKTILLMYIFDDFDGYSLPSLQRTDFGATITNRRTHAQMKVRLLTLK